MGICNFKNKINKLRAKVDKKLFPRLVRRLWLNQSYGKGLTMLSYPPEYLQIDVTSYCNLRCKMCPQGIPGYIHERGAMDMALYKKVINSAADAHIFSVFLVLTGEPLLHKDIVEMIQYAGKKGLRTSISTNCVMLTPLMSEALIKSGLDEIILSFDTVNKELYEDYRRGAKYEQILNNILVFLEMRGKLKSQKPFPIMCNLQRFNPNKPSPEVEKDFNEVFGRYNAWIIPKYFSNWSGIMQEEKEFYCESGIGPHRQYQLCPTVYQRIVVSWDGKVVSCCNDFNRQQIMGDMRNQSIAEIWNGKEFVNLRRKLADKTLEALPLCRTCGVLWK